MKEIKKMTENSEEKYLVSSFSNVKSLKFANRSRYPSIRNLVEIYDKKNYTNSPKQVRLFGPILVVHSHICEFYKDLPDGTKQKKMFTMPCSAFDVVTGEYIEDHNCPLCKAEITSSEKFYINAIIRDIEEDINNTLSDEKKATRTPDEKKAAKLNGVGYFLRSYSKAENSYGDITYTYSKSPSPVKVLELSRGCVGKIKDIERMNIRKENGISKTYPITDLDHGIDITIEYRPNASSPGDMYSIMAAMGGETPITKEYRRDVILAYNLNVMPPVDEADLLAEFTRSCGKIINANNQDYINSLKLASNTQKTVSAPLNAPNIKTISLDDDNIDYDKLENEIKSSKAKATKLPDDDDDFTDL